MNQYRTLITNTVLFGLSTFGSRFLNFLLTPFYTRILTSAQYGVTDLIIQTGNLIIPLAAAGIGSGVIRFGLERGSDKAAVFTTGVVVTLAGSAVLLAVSPLLEGISFLSGYVWLVLLYVVAANLHSVCSQFARTMGHIRLFALDGVLRTVLAIGFNILLLAVFPLGIAGYVLASVFADVAAALFVFLRAGQWRYLRLPAMSRAVTARMLRYCVPLIPSGICGWIISMSDRYLIALLMGSAATGIYAVSNKIPTVLLSIANVFTSAWQLSALAERPKGERIRFFSNVYSVYSAIAFLAASAVILTAQISTRLLAAPEYYEAWRYVPVLTLGTTFACLGSFLSSIYMVEKRSAAILATTVAGAAANLVGNFFLIQLWGAMGAAVSTLLSYLLILVLRGGHSRRLLPIRWELGRFLPSVLLLALQCVLTGWELPLWRLWSGLCLLAVAAVNVRPLWSAVRKAV